MKSTRNHERSPENETVTFSLPKTLSKKLKEMAAVESRSLSAQVRHLLADEVEYWHKQRRRDAAATDPKENKP